MLSFEGEHVDQYLELVAIDDLEKQYREEGYAVYRQVVIGDLRCDLLLQKQQKKIYIEVVVRGSDRKKEDRDKILQLHKAIKGLGSNAEFRTVFVGRPKQISVDIDDIETLLYTALLNDPSSDLPSLGSEVRLDQVRDVEVERIEVRPNYIYVTGSLMADVEIREESDCDSEHRDETTVIDSFLGIFEVTLDGALTIIKSQFHFDSLSW